MANSSRAINWGAIFSAVSWSKSLPITVLGSCNIPECYSKFFFRPNLLLLLLLFDFSNSMGSVDCICSNRQKMDFSAMQFIISVALHVCPLICATKEKQTMMLTVLYQTNCKLQIAQVYDPPWVGGGRRGLVGSKTLYWAHWVWRGAQQEWLLGFAVTQGVSCTGLSLCHLGKVSHDVSGV